jgi:thymidylate synthase (FAD)
MSKVKLYVQLLARTDGGAAVAAMGAKLCYSPADIEALQEKTSAQDQSAFLKKLTDMGHFSPIEHVNFTFGVEGVSRTLLAQLTRHRLASFSVQSQRYVTQTRSEGFNYILPPAIEALGQEAAEQYAAQMQQMQRWYDEWMERLGAQGKEDARFVLPNAAETKLVMTMNARELRHMLSIRGCTRAQWEIRAMAWAMLGHCMKEAPALFEEGVGPACLQGPCPEGAMSCGKSIRMRQLHEELKAFVAQNKEREDFAQRISDWAAENIAR